MISVQLPPKIPSDFPIETTSKYQPGERSGDLIMVMNSDTLSPDLGVYYRSVVSEYLRDKRALRGARSNEIITSIDGQDMINMLALYNLMIDCAELRVTLANGMLTGSDEEIVDIVYEALYFHVYGELDRTYNWPGLQKAWVETVHGLDYGRSLLSAIDNAYIEGVKRMPESRKPTPTERMQIKDFIIGYITNAVVVGITVNPEKTP